MKPAAVALVAVLAFIVGDIAGHYVFWPWSMFETLQPPMPPGSPIPNGPAQQVPVVSRAQGAQDAARSETLRGSEPDMQTCQQTLVARKVDAAEARQTCRKLFGG